MDTLFDLEPEGEPENLPSIAGLRYIPDYIDDKQHRWLLKTIDQGEWLTELKRRVQHYGYRYGYGQQSSLIYLGDLPKWAARFGAKLTRDKITKEAPDQLIVNEYEPGQGIAPHVDKEIFFADTIVSLSLGSRCIMDLIHTQTRERVSILLAPKSLLIFEGEARHDWKHGISPRKTDIYHGSKIKRERRVSLTFRNVKNQ
ncbi:MAG: alpha-ketoglutarate-dependent dioxygenase AlkB [Candidatus Peribacteraceae bacterium]|nr:alpha-ketoglutarate-dependent dioxygenase AlkB [Candidatus Peribacteraceae bacterium]